MYPRWSLRGLDALVQWTHRDKIRHLSLILVDAADSISIAEDDETLIPKLRSMRGLESFVLVPTRYDLQTNWSVIFSWNTRSSYKGLYCMKTVCNGCVRASYCERRRIVIVVSSVVLGKQRMQDSSRVATT